MSASLTAAAHRSRSRSRWRCGFGARSQRSVVKGISAGEGGLGEWGGWVGEGEGW